MVADTPMNFSFQNIFFTPSHSTFGTPSAKTVLIFFLLSKKSFDKTYLKIFLDIIIFFLDLRPFWRKYFFSHTRCWVSKKCVWISFLKKFMENIQKLRFWFWNFWKRSNFEAFFVPITLKTENVFKKCWW